MENVAELQKLGLSLIVKSLWLKQELSSENNFKLALCLHPPERTPHLHGSVFPLRVLERLPRQKGKCPLEASAPCQGEVGTAATQPLSYRLELRRRESAWPSKQRP